MMSIFDLNDVKTIITKHLLKDKTVNTFSMTKVDDHLQKILFGEVKAMEISLFEIKNYSEIIMKLLMMRSNFLNKIITKFIPKKPFAIPFIFGLNFETFLAEGRQFALQKFLDTEREGLLWRMHVTMHRSLAPGLFSGALSKRNGHSGASNATYRL